MGSNGASWYDLAYGLGCCSWGINGAFLHGHWYKFRIRGYNGRAWGHFAYTDVQAAF